MQLKQLKLAGFKSFVEPTTIPFSSQLVAVVGPNGCGKSNIIDAVRWVMGESSAKNLRGESMTDVIFNGSSLRKPIGQAFVELVFDNSLGRLAGPYAAYQEIAIKRLVTRAGESCYYLNGSRCRRKDITDIFLGTGSGARGYSIIGQDMISRLIEARPEDLKAYLEEAAGISKYKERRRETLLRISHTRDNLARITDVSDELGKQLLRLERQAKAAERYKALKKEERLCKTEILALKWRALSKEQADTAQNLRQLTLNQDHHRSQMTGHVKNAVLLREQLHKAQEDTQHTQLKFFELSTDIARLEENIRQQQREKERLTTDKQQTLTELQATTHDLESHLNTLAACEETLIILQATVQDHNHQFTLSQQALDDSEQMKLDASQQWQQAQNAVHQNQRDVQKEELSLHHINQRYRDIQCRYEKNQSDCSELTTDPLQNELSTLNTQSLQLAKQQQIAAEKHHTITQKCIELREQLSATEQQIHQAQDRLQTLNLQHAKLFAIQNTALRHPSKEGSALPKWEQFPRLAETITVDTPWLNTCEKILGEGLQAIVLDSMECLLPDLPSLKGHASAFITPAHTTSTDAPHPRLSDQVIGKLPCWANRLEHIFTATSLEEALAWLPTLKHHESIVTGDGYWLGPGWIKIDGSEPQEEAGLLARQQTLAKLDTDLALASKQLKKLQANRDKTHTALIHAERDNDALKQELLLSQAARNANESQISQKQQERDQIVTRLKTLADESLSLKLDIEELSTQKMITEDKLQHTQEKAARTHQELQQHTDTKEHWEKVYSTSRGALEAARNALHQTELQYQQNTLKVQQLRDKISQEQQRADSLQARLKTLEQHYIDLTNPSVLPPAILEEKLQQHHQLNDTLTLQREQEEALQQELKQREQQHQQEEKTLQALQERIQQEQLREQTLLVRTEHLTESLTSLEANLDAVLAQLPTEASLEEKEQQIISLDEKIQRLGAINLVAIEEYQTEIERKQHLDAQHEDLISALTTLEAAIAKMDKETQLRLKDTFDQINSSFQSLFPRLFEGGCARLELTCDNLLEAGVLVMAQPPGKRNGTIHLLSGGEKAMTAVALVFAIFQLNPSPFCMLDEVDAPLDDINVKRFCSLVKEMSEFVQFLFITHNKVTMELAEHLIGVTMREPGVSRLVAVDVKEALSIIE